MTFSIEKPRGTQARRAISGLLLACFVGGLFSATAAPCQAQSGEDIAKGLLRALIESQLEKSRRKADARLSPQPPGRPGFGGPPRETQEILQLRPIAASLSQESATLVALLQTDARRSLAPRPFLADAIRLQANAAALRQRTAGVRNHILVQDDFRSLNNEWSALAFHLDACASISNQTRGCAKRIAALDEKYCALLGIQEQFNSRELIRAAYTLTTYTTDLMDDVRDTYRPGNRHRQLVRDVGRFAQKTDYFASLVSQGNPYSTVVSSLQDLYEDWRQLESQLTEYNGHSTTRTASRIQTSFRDIHDLLRLEIGLNRDQVLHLVHTIDQEISDVFRTITLEQLMSLPDGQNVPAAADTLYGTIQNLDDLIRRDQNPQEIGAAWVYADEAWKEFEFFLNPVRAPQTAQRLRKIADSMTSLKQALGVTVQYDRTAVVRSASTMAFLTNQLLRTVQKWHQRTGQPNRPLQTRIQQLEAAMQRMEQTLASGASQRNQLRDCDQAIALWQQIRPELKACDTTEKVELEHLAGSITSEGIRLRTMLTE